MFLTLFFDLDFFNAFFMVLITLMAFKVFFCNVFWRNIVHHFFFVFTFSSLKIFESFSYFLSNFSLTVLIKFGLTKKSVLSQAKNKNGDSWKLTCINQLRLYISHLQENSKNFNVASIYFSIFHKTSPGSWVEHTVKDFVTCCCSPEAEPPRGVPWKEYSENMQQIYRRTPMPKCNFSKVAL